MATPHQQRGRRAFTNLTNTPPSVAGKPQSQPAQDKTPQSTGAAAKTSAACTPAAVRPVKPQNRTPGASAHKLPSFLGTPKTPANQPVALLSPDVPLTPPECRAMLDAINSAVCSTEDKPGSNEMPSTLEGWMKQVGISEDISSNLKDQLQILYDRACEAARLRSFMEAMKINELEMAAHEADDTARQMDLLADENTFLFESKSSLLSDNELLRLQLQEAQAQLESRLQLQFREQLQQQEQQFHEQQQQQEQEQQQQQAAAMQVSLPLQDSPAHGNAEGVTHPQQQQRQQQQQHEATSRGAHAASPSPSLVLPQEQLKAKEAEGASMPGGGAHMPAHFQVQVHPCTPPAGALSPGGAPGAETGALRTPAWVTHRDDPGAPSPRFSTVPIGTPNLDETDTWMRLDARMAAQHAHTPLDTPSLKDALAWVDSLNLLASQSKPNKASFGSPQPAGTAANHSPAATAAVGRVEADVATAAGAAGGAAERGSTATAPSPAVTAAVHSNSAATATGAAGTAEGGHSPIPSPPHHLLADLASALATPGATPAADARKPTMPGTPAASSPSFGPPAQPASAPPTDRGSLTTVSRWTPQQMLYAEWAAANGLTPVSITSKRPGTPPSVVSHFIPRAHLEADCEGVHAAAATTPALGHQFSSQGSNTFFDNSLFENSSNNGGGRDPACHKGSPAPATAAPGAATAGDGDGESGTAAAPTPVQMQREGSAGHAALTASPLGSQCGTTPGCRPTAASPSVCGSDLSFGSCGTAGFVCAGSVTSKAARARAPVQAREQDATAQAATAFANAAAPTATGVHAADVASDPVRVEAGGVNSMHAGQGAREPEPLSLGDVMSPAQGLHARGPAPSDCEAPAADALTQGGAGGPPRTPSGVLSTPAQQQQQQQQQQQFHDQVQQEQQQQQQWGGQQQQPAPASDAATSSFASALFATPMERGGSAGFMTPMSARGSFHTGASGFGPGTASRSVTSKPVHAQPQPNTHHPASDAPRSISQQLFAGHTSSPARATPQPPQPSFAAAFEAGTPSAPPAAAQPALRSPADNANHATPAASAAATGMCVREVATSQASSPAGSLVVNVADPPTPPSATSPPYPPSHSSTRSRSPPSSLREEAARAGNSAWALLCSDDDDDDVSGGGGGAEGGGTEGSWEAGDDVRASRDARDQGPVALSPLLDVHAFQPPRMDQSTKPAHHPSLTPPLGEEMAAAAAHANEQSADPGWAILRYETPSPAVSQLGSHATPPARQVATHPLKPVVCPWGKQQACQSASPVLHHHARTAADMASGSSSASKLDNAAYSGFKPMSLMWMTGSVPPSQIKGVPGGPVRVYRTDAHMMSTPQAQETHTPGTHSAAHGTPPSIQLSDFVAATPYHVHPTSKLATPASVPQSGHPQHMSPVPMGTPHHMHPASKLATPASVPQSGHPQQMSPMLMGTPHHMHPASKLATPASASSSAHPQHMSPMPMGNDSGSCWAVPCAEQQASPMPAFALSQNASPVLAAAKGAEHKSPTAAHEHLLGTPAASPGMPTAAATETAPARAPAPPAPASANKGSGAPASAIADLLGTPVGTPTAPTAQPAPGSVGHQQGHVHTSWGGSVAAGLLGTPTGTPTGDHARAAAAADGAAAGGAGAGGEHEAQAFRPGTWSESLPMPLLQDLLGSPAPPAQAAAEAAEAAVAKEVHTTGAGVRSVCGSVHVEQQEWGSSSSSSSSSSPERELGGKERGDVGVGGAADDAVRAGSSGQAVERQARSTRHWGRRLTEEEEREVRRRAAALKIHVSPYFKASKARARRAALAQQEP